MGLLDKVKAQATQVAGRAQEAGRAGQAKLEEVQAKRRIDALLRELGEAVYAEQTGGGSAGSGAVARLVDEIRAAKADQDAAHAREVAQDEGDGPDDEGEGGGGDGPADQADEE